MQSAANLHFKDITLSLLTLYNTPTRDGNLNRNTIHLMHHKKLNKYNFHDLQSLQSQQIKMNCLLEILFFYVQPASILKRNSRNEISNRNGFSELKQCFTKILGAVEINC